MAQVLQPPHRTIRTLVPVRDDGPESRGDTVHAARLVDVGNGELRPVLPVCDELIVAVPADGPVTCEICRIRLRPDTFTKVVRLVLGVVRRRLPWSPALPK
ncbi:MAG: hypothetical protein GEV03_05215 [Streptosporangiales bacterium]|nr:hypothetical protein [Streptosporangiales bacterium]